MTDAKEMPRPGWSTGERAAHGGERRLAKTAYGIARRGAVESQTTSRVASSAWSVSKRCGARLPYGRVLDVVEATTDRFS